MCSQALAHGLCVPSKNGGHFDSMGIDWAAVIFVGSVQRDTQKMAWTVSNPTGIRVSSVQTSSHVKGLQIMPWCVFVLDASLTRCHANGAECCLLGFFRWVPSYLSAAVRGRVLLYA